MPVMRPDQVKAFANAGQHPQRQNVDLQNPQRVDIVLVPFNKCAVRHRPVANRHRVRQRPLGQDKAADMLAQMPRHPDHLPRHDQGAPQQRTRQIDTGLARVALAYIGAPTAPDGFRKGRCHVL